MSKFENFEKFLACIDSDMVKIFEHQKEYIVCKKGCSYCCKRGDFPLSKIEFDYLMSAYQNLDIETKNLIEKNIDKIKKEGNFDSYNCPFLIDEVCSVYSRRPFACRVFGVLTEDSSGKPSFPFCTTIGLNFSQIYDKEKQHLSFELVQKNNFKTFPKFFRLSNNVIMNLPYAKELNIDFGEAKRLIDFL